MDFVVDPNDYSVRPPQAPVLVIAIDVALIKDVAEAVVESLDALLGDDDDDDEAAQGKLDATQRVGIIIFGGDILFAQKTDGFVVMGDVDEPFCPCAPSTWLMTAQEAKERLASDDFTQAAVTACLEGNVAFSCLAAIGDGLRDVGGKLVLLTSSGPTSGIVYSKEKKKTSPKAGGDPEGVLKLSSALSLLSTTTPGSSPGASKEKRKGHATPLNAATLADLAASLGDRLVAVEVLLIEGDASSPAADIAGLARLAGATGGRLRVPRDGALQSNLDTVMAWALQDDDDDGVDLTPVQSPSTHMAAQQSQFYQVPTTTTTATPRHPWRGPAKA